MPTAFLSDWSNASLPVAQFAFNWLLQSLALTAIGLAAAAAARRFGSATQSAIYRTTLVAVLVAPLATTLVGWLGISGWSIPMPQGIVSIDDRPLPGRLPVVDPVAEEPSPATSTPRAEPLPEPAVEVAAPERSMPFPRQRRFDDFDDFAPSRFAPPMGPRFEP